MADMVLAAGLFRERDVTFHLPPLAFRTDALMPVRTAVLPVMDIAAPQQVVDLAVRHDRLPHLCSAAHRLFHQAVRLHAAAIVRKADDLGRQRRKIDQPAAAALPYRNAAVGNYAASRRMMSVCARSVCGVSGAGFRFGIEHTVV